MTTLKWFGRNWGATICIPENNVSTPQGPCYLCERSIVPGQTGVVVPFGGPPEDPRTEVPIHLKCYVDGLVTNRV